MGPAADAKQSLRLRRFLLASTTYAVGFLILALCHVFGLLAAADLALIGLTFALVNGVLYTVFRLGWNLRSRDPSLTREQVGTAACTVVLILALGEHIPFVAVPFYSAIFVFAMLRLKPRELVVMEAFVLVTYAAALVLRMELYDGRLDLRLEAIHAALVVLSSVWYACAAGYIGTLRARLRASVQTIEQLASRDALTGLWNRRQMDALLSAELQRQARQGSAFSVLLLDLDHFKTINDRYGHLVGDTVLKAAALALQSQLRGADQLARFGGEEFLVLLPDAVPDEARRCALRLLGAVAELAVLPDASQRVTVSIGLAAALPGESSDALLQRADRALYRAKAEGRNRLALGLPAEAGGVEAA